MYSLFEAVREIFIPSAHEVTGSASALRARRRAEGHRFLYTVASRLGTVGAERDQALARPVIVSMRRSSSSLKPRFFSAPTLSSI